MRTASRGWWLTNILKRTKGVLCSLLTSVALTRNQNSFVLPTFPRHSFRTQYCVRKRLILSVWGWFILHNIFFSKLSQNELQMHSDFSSYPLSYREHYSCKDILKKNGALKKGGLWLVRKEYFKCSFLVFCCKILTTLYLNYFPV